MESGKVRVRRSLTEKRRIVELTFLPGQSVACVAQTEGVNANQVFQWRRDYRNDLLEADSTALLPVVVPTEGFESTGVQSVSVFGAASKLNVQEQRPATTGSIHIELAGRATISVESGADRRLLLTILETLRK